MVDADFALPGRRNIKMESARRDHLPAPDDWRRQAQDEYLMGVRLRLMKWRMSRPGWDHDHCSFCRAKISAYEGDLRTGYATDDEYHWICPKCFEDFREEFRWTAEPGTEPESERSSSPPSDH
jgi:hypothetical protein